MHLLDLPPELFEQVVVVLVDTVPVAELRGLRAVCRAFARDIQYQSKRLPKKEKRIEKKICGWERELDRTSEYEKSFGLRINCSRGWGLGVRW
ncbi:hypothetical protein PTTW11_05604 [Pyrenophora teres f. teres]|uniref:Uncharacterized protein n=1 Tax=Pyrenophora teres f. teres TaxID=97479 RepID=A0A6S6W2D6_9PLEO|nr:hypothetical protein PTTW11_05604 [Pyrenophora teres f. teres]